MVEGVFFALMDIMRQMTRYIFSGNAQSLSRAKKCVFHIFIFLNKIWYYRKNISYGCFEEDPETVKWSVSYREKPKLGTWDRIRSLSRLLWNGNGFRFISYPQPCITLKC